MRIIADFAAPSSAHALYISPSCPLLIGYDGLTYFPKTSSGLINADNVFYQKEGLVGTEMPTMRRSKFREKANCFLRTRRGAWKPCLVDWFDAKRKQVIIHLPISSNHGTFLLQELKAEASQLFLSGDLQKETIKSIYTPLMAAEAILRGIKGRLVEPLNVYAIRFNLATDYRNEKGLTLYYDYYSFEYLNKWAAVDKTWANNSFNPYCYYPVRFLRNYKYPACKGFHSKHPPVWIGAEPKELEDWLHLQPFKILGITKGYYSGSPLRIQELIVSKRSALISLLIGLGWAFEFGKPLLPIKAENAACGEFSANSAIFGYIGKYANFSYPADYLSYELLLNCLKASLLLV